MKLLLFVIAISSFLTTEARRPVHEYLLDDLDRLSIDVEAIKWVDQQVEDKEGSSPEELAQYFDQATKVADKVLFGSSLKDLNEEELIAKIIALNHKHVPKLKKQLEFLASLSPDGLKCDRNSVDYFIRTVNVVLGSFESFNSTSNALITFMRYFAIKNYDQCLQDAQSKLSGELRTWSTVDAATYNLMYKFAAVLTRGINPVALWWSYDLLEELDFVGGKFHAEEMAKRVKLYISEAQSLRKTHTEALVQFLSRSCAKVPPEFMKPHLDVYNLGFALAPIEASKIDVGPDQENLLELNEFMRLCLQLENPQTREKAIENIDKNMIN